jgi:hypothetical protein
MDTIEKKGFVKFKMSLTVMKCDKLPPQNTHAMAYMNITKLIIFLSK